MNLFVNARFLTQPITGVQRYGIECCRQIKRICPTAQFIAPQNIMHESLAMELDCHVVGKHTGHFWEQYDLPKYLRKQNSPPLLNLANTAPLNYSNNFITIHDLSFHYYPQWNSRGFATWYNFLIPRLARRAKGIFTVSKTVQNEIVKAYRVPKEQITVAYNGIGAQWLEQEVSQTKKEKIILSVGSITKRKNQATLIKAYLQSALRDSYQLVLVGDKHPAFADAGIDERKLGMYNIQVKGGVSGTELEQLYQKSEIVVSLSLYEGFGIPVLEGLFFGCKAICSDIPVYREIYDGYTHYCDPNDPRAVALCLQHCAERNITNPGLEQLTRKYSYAQSAKTIIEKIENSI